MCKCAFTCYRMFEKTRNFNTFVSLLCFIVLKCVCKYFDFRWQNVVKNCHKFLKIDIKKGVIATPLINCTRCGTLALCDGHFTVFIRFPHCAF